MNFVGLGAVKIWLEDCPENRESFMLRFWAYISLRLDAAIANVRLVVLEERV